MMKRMNFPRRAGIVAAAVAVLTLGFSSYAGAQIVTGNDVTDFKTCFNDTPGFPSQYQPPYWTGFCSAFGKLPIGFPELSFGFGFTDTISAPQITFNGTTVTITAKVPTIYLDNSGIHVARDYEGNSTATLVLSANVDSTGKLTGGSGGACDGTPGDDLDDFCVQGMVRDPVSGATSNGILLRGTFRSATKGFAYKKHAIDHVECPLGFVQQPDGSYLCPSLRSVAYDDFEFLLQLTGGIWFNHDNVNDTDLTDISHVYGNLLVLEGFANTNDYMAADKFAAGLGFTAPYVWGIATPTASSATGAQLNACTGQISGSVTDYFTGAEIPGANAQLTGLAPLTTNVLVDASTGTLPAGHYSSANNLCAGTYTVSPAGITGYAAYGTGTATVTLTTNSDLIHGSGVNFRLYSVPATTSFTTYNQGSWGTKAKAQNTGQFLATWFSLVYPSGLEVGLTGTTGFSIIETTPVAIADILPQEGKPVRLTADYTDPAALLRKANKARYAHHRQLGSLAGETMALELNVDFSKFSLTRKGLGGLHVASGALAGQTVDQVLALGNKVLGGGLALPNAAWPTLKNYDTLEDVIEAINRNYQAGAIDRHYLIP